MEDVSHEEGRNEETNEEFAEDEEFDNSEAEDDNPEDGFSFEESDYSMFGHSTDSSEDSFGKKLGDLRKAEYVVNKYDDIKNALDADSTKRGERYISYLKQTYSDSFSNNDLLDRENFERLVSDLKICTGIDDSTDNTYSEGDVNTYDNYRDMSMSNIES